MTAFIKSLHFLNFWKHWSTILTSTLSPSYRVSRLQARHSYFDNKKVCFSLQLHVQQESTCVLAQSGASSCTHHPGHPAQPHIVTTVPLNCTIQALPEWFLQYCADCVFVAGFKNGGTCEQGSPARQVFGYFFRQDASIEEEKIEAKNQRLCHEWEGYEMTRKEEAEDDKWAYSV